MGRGPETGRPDRDEEAPEKTPSPLMTWAAREPRKAMALIIVLFVPYLVICMGLAVAFARIMTVGTCG